MAALGRDTPSYCSTTTLPDFWNDAHADAEVIAGEGYGGGAAWTGASESAYLTRNGSLHGHVWVPPGQSEFALSHPIRVETLPAAEKELLVILALDGTKQCVLSLRTDGKLAIWRGGLAGVELARSVTAIPLSVSLDVGFAGTIDNAAVPIAGYLGLSDVPTSWAPFVSAVDDTMFHATDRTWRGYTLGLAPDIFQSDLVWRDGRLTDGGIVGLSPGARVGTRRPAAAGILTAWSPNTGTLHAALDDADQDGDTTHARSNAVPGNAGFSVGLDAVQASARYYGTTTIVVARNSSAFPSLGMRPLIVSDAAGSPVTHPGPLIALTDSAWRPGLRSDAVNPRTGALYTQAELDALEAGAASDV